MPSHDRLARGVPADSADQAPGGPAGVRAGRSTDDASRVNSSAVPRSMSEVKGHADRDRRVRALFDEAIELEGMQRTAFLTGVRQHDPDAYADVFELLSLSDTSAPLLDSGARNLAGIIIGRERGESFPVPLGKFTLVRQIGMGGMGIVYEATEAFPKRTVALKLVRPEVTTPTLIKRLTHEASVLAKVRHPGIAQLYEAGFVMDKYERRVPFLSMELIEGRTLSRFVREDKPALRAKLELLAKLCDAVDHAHRRGIVHRDLKPGNILIVNDAVSGEPLPKVLDFGIARLTEETDGMTIVTGTNQLFGTLGYMSPEQLTGQSQQIDSRCDVYALGVIAYEAFAGHLPVEIDGLTAQAAAARVLTMEPRLLGSMDRALRGDVESIVAKAIEKDPAKRYQSASEFAADLRRHVRDEPVTAARQTTAYQLRKLVRRNKVVFVAGTIAAAIALASLVVGGGMALWKAAQARDAARTSHNIGSFLQEVLTSPSPEAGMGRDVSVRRLLEAKAPIIDERFAEDPATRRELHAVLGETMHALGDDRQASEHYAKALALLPRDTLEQQRAAILWQVARAKALHRNDQWDEAEPLLRDALDKSLTLQGPDHPDTAWVRGWLGSVLTRQCHFKEARAMLEASLSTLRATLGDEEPRTVTMFVQLGEWWTTTSTDWPERERTQARAETLARKVLGPTHPKTLAIEWQLWQTRHARAMLLRRGGGAASVGEDQSPFTPLQIAEGYERAVQGLSQRLGSDHPEMLRSLMGLRLAYEDAGRGEDALRVLEQVHISSAARLGDSHIQTIALLNSIGALLSRLGRPEDALPIHARVLAVLDQREQPSYIGNDARLGIARAYFLLGKLPEARDATADGLHFWATTGKGSINTITASLISLGSIEFDLGNYASAFEYWAMGVRSTDQNVLTLQPIRAVQAMHDRLDALPPDVATTLSGEVERIRALAAGISPKSDADYEQMGRDVKAYILRQWPAGVARPSGMGEAGAGAAVVPTPSD